MPRFMLLLHENPEAFAGRSPDEMMAVIKEYGAWADRMRTEGRLQGGEKLADDPGRVLRPRQGGGVAVTDGPYAESKEVVGGYFMIAAADYAEAERAAETCPHLKYGGRIELRQIHDL